MKTIKLSERAIKILKSLNADIENYKGSDLPVFSPINGEKLLSLKFDDKKTLAKKISSSEKAFKFLRDIPAPKRGELIRLFGEELRKNKEALSELVTIECGKILEEGRGEVQEMIDICDFAVGLSRQLYGLTIASERGQHVMQENWLPLGPVLVISAFNFPVAVWAWNAALAIVCGDSVIWKPSEKTPLTSIATQAIFLSALKEFRKNTDINIQDSISEIVIGERDVGEELVKDERIKLVSATGSTRMGKEVGPIVSMRFGKTLLELGGNNAVIVSDKADINLALQSILFGAVGTAGQRCTTTRRVVIHKKIYAEVFEKLKNAYASIIKNKIGSPLDKGTLIGPLIDKNSFEQMQKALEKASKEGAKVFYGKRSKFSDLAYYVEPALVKCTKQIKVAMEEVFAPILYVIPYSNIEEAVEINNAVAQGLSSAIFTTDVREAEYFKQYSDCGITNVNIGTSGAEIGGAFGGEKETGGGRESGSDSWKIYMRRQTSTTYYGYAKPALAQGIKFEA